MKRMGINHSPAPVYSADYTLCGSTTGPACVNLQSDSKHCGACDTACTGNNECQAGLCACKQGFANCAEGSTDCTTDLQSDAAHCGACNNTCRGGKECQRGSCACPAGEAEGGWSYHNVLVSVWVNVRCCMASTASFLCGVQTPGWLAGWLYTRLSCNPGWPTRPTSCRVLSKWQASTSAAGSASPRASAAQMGRAAPVTQVEDGCHLPSPSSALFRPLTIVCQPPPPIHSPPQVPLPAGLQLCGTDITSWLCADLQSDSSHCGACDTVCPAGNDCQLGVCACSSGEEPSHTPDIWITMACVVYVCGWGALPSVYDVRQWRGTST